MADFYVRADAVDVEQIMRQIRARIREKRGVDYTEEQIQELANAKLEKFLDPKRRPLRPARAIPADAAAVPPTYEFEDTTLFDSGKPLIGFFRSLLRPFLKLFFNPNVAQLDAAQAGRVQPLRLRACIRLYFELMHNLVVEMTRLAHRGEEHEDARRVGAEPARLQRAPRARARKRRAIQAGRAQRPARPRRATTTRVQSRRAEPIRSPAARACAPDAAGGGADDAGSRQAPGAAPDAATARP